MGLPPAWLCWCSSWSGSDGIAALGPVILLAGAIQLVAGLCRAGVWFRMTSPAVVAGMLSGIGILIVASQAHVLMDAAPKARGLENFAALPAVLWQAISEGTGRTALFVGLATIGIILAWDKLRPQRLRFLPGALIAVVAVTAAVQLQGLNVAKVDVPTNLFSAISIPSISDIFGVFNATLLVSAVTFAFIASAETLLSAAAVDRMHQGARTNYDRELAAQGVGNMLCGFLGALPMTGVIVRSAANVQAGAATRMSTVLHGGWLLVFAMLLPWLLRMTPVACLAGILVYTGVKMIKIGQVKELATYGRGTAAIYLATTFAIVATDLLTGVLIGFGLSLFRLALHSSRLKVDVREHERQEGRDASDPAGFGNVPEGAGDGAYAGKRAAQYRIASGRGQAAPCRPRLHRIAARLEPECGLARLRVGGGLERAGSTRGRSANGGKRVGRTARRTSQGGVNLLQTARRSRRVTPVVTG